LETLGHKTTLHIFGTTNHLPFEYPLGLKKIAALGQRHPFPRTVLDPPVELFDHGGFASISILQSFFTSQHIHGSFDDWTVSFNIIGMAVIVKHHLASIIKFKQV